MRWYKRQMKKQAGRMLAIGDGANDVAMIQVGCLTALGPEGAMDLASSLVARTYVHREGPRKAFLSLAILLLLRRIIRAARVAKISVSCTHGSSCTPYSHGPCS